MKLITTFTIACLFTFFSGPAFADEMFSVKAGYQLLTPEGEFGSNNFVIDDRIDMEDDLNFDDSEDVTAEIALQLGNSRLSFGYLPIKTSGTGIITVPIDFNGIQFDAGVATSGAVNLDLYDIGYTYYLVNFDDLPSRFQLGLELAVKIVDGDMSVTGEQLGVQVTESVSGTAPIPTLGARARVALADFVGLAGRIGYLEFDGSQFLDADAQLEFSPLPMVGLYAGYRYFDLKIDNDNIDVFVDASFSGPYAGAFVRF